MLSTAQASARGAVSPPNSLSPVPNRLTFIDVIFAASRLRPASAGKRWNVKKRTDRVDRLDPLTRDALAWVMRLKSGEATLADVDQLFGIRQRGLVQKVLLTNTPRP